jgi:hypothetical protein
MALGSAAAMRRATSPAMGIRLLTSAATSGLFSQSSGGPERALRYELEKVLIAPRVIGVAIRRAEDAGFAVLIDPRHGVGFAILFAHGTRQRFGVGPQLLHDVELVHRRDPIGRDAFQDRVGGGNEFHRILALMIVVFAGDTEKLPPVVNLRGPIGVHGAMNYDCGHAGVVGRGDLAEVNLVGRVGETFVVDNDVVTFSPVGIVVEGNLRARSVAAFHYHGPINCRQFGHGVGELLGLERIIVAATPGDQQGAQRFWFCGGT